MALLEAKEEQVRTLTAALETEQRSRPWRSSNHHRVIEKTWQWWWG